MILNLFILLCGVFSCSVSVIFIKLSTEHPVLLAAYRLLVAAVILTPFFLRDMKRYSIKLTLNAILPSVIPGATLAVHLISWIIGARLTLAAHSTLIVNMVPAVMPLFLYVTTKETLNRWEVIGTVLSITGVLLLGVVDFQFSREFFIGDLICFISMILFALYLAFGRSNRHAESIWLYLVPLYYCAGILCMCVSLFFVDPIKPYTIENIIAVLGLGIVSTVIGHSSLNYSMKHFRGQTVSIINLSQFLFAGVMGYILLKEVPPPLFYTCGLMVAGGAAIAIMHTGK